jgi:hypothetical protein
VRTMVTERQKKLIQKQDEYNGQLILFSQQVTPCVESCKECKSKIKNEAFGTTCVHLIIKRIVDEMVT